MSQLGRGNKKPKTVSGARFAPAPRHSDGPVRPPHTVPTSGSPADTREHDDQRVGQREPVHVSPDLCQVWEIGQDGESKSVWIADCKLMLLDHGTGMLRVPREPYYMTGAGAYECAEGLRTCPTGASPPRSTLDSVIVAAAISYDRKRAD